MPLICGIFPCHIFPWVWLRVERSCAGAPCVGTLPAALQPSFGHVKRDDRRERCGAADRIPCPQQRTQGSLCPQSQMLSDALRAAHCSSGRPSAFLAFSSRPRRGRGSQRHVRAGRGEARSATCGSAVRWVRGARAQQRGPVGRRLSAQRSCWVPGRIVTARDVMRTHEGSSAFLSLGLFVFVVFFCINE